MGGKTASRRDAQMRELIADYLPEAKRGERSTEPVIADAVGEESPATVADAAEEVAAANSRVPRARPGDETDDSGALAYAADEGPQDIVAAALAETGATDDGKDATEGDVSDSEAIETVDDPIALRIQTASSVAEFADITLQSDGSGLDPIARLTQLARLRAGMDDIVAGAAAPERTVAGEAVSGKRQAGWHVQIGAVPTVEGAHALLDKAKATIGTKFASLHPVTQEVESRGTTLYRARFAGFSDKEEARAACQKLKSKSFSCLAVPELSLSGASDAFRGSGPWLR